jgi:cytochrome c551/c552
MVVRHIREGIQGTWDKLRMSALDHLSSADGKAFAKQVLEC